MGASGSISTFAGTGAPFERGDGSPASLARFSGEIGAVAVGPEGNLYVADRYDHTVRRIDVAGMASTLAGTGRAGFGGDGGPASGALLDGPAGVAADSTGNVYVADTGNHRLRRMDGAGMITTIAGTGEAGYSGEGHPATSSMLNQPERTAVDGGGSVYVLDTGNSRVRVVGAAGLMQTLVGNGERDSAENLELLGVKGYLKGRGVLPRTYDLAVDPADLGGGFLLHLLVADTGGDGTLWSLSPNNPGIQRRGAHERGATAGLAAAADGSVYFADRTAVRSIARDGSVSTVAEFGEYGISVGGLAVDGFGRIWFSDPEHRRVRVLEPVR